MINSGLDAISALGADSKLSANVAKANTCAENNAGNPGANCNTFLGDVCAQSILQSCSIEKCIANGCTSWGWNQLGLQAEDDTHPSDSNGGREEEAGPGAID